MRSASAPASRAPWRPPVGIDAVVGSWLESGYVRPCLAADRAFAPSAGAYADFPPDLPLELTSALRARGIDRLYAHQTEAVLAAREGRHVVIATPTASGKSLCFHLPVLEALARSAGRDAGNAGAASAIYLFPTKALARDQEANLRQLV